MSPKKKTDEPQRSRKPVKKTIEPKGVIQPIISERTAAEIVDDIIYFDTAKPIRHTNPESLGMHLSEISEKGNADAAQLYQALMVIKDVEPEHYPVGALAVVLQKAPAVLTQLSDEITRLAGRSDSEDDQTFMRHQVQMIQGPELQGLFLELASVLKIQNVSFGSTGATKAAL